MKPSATRMGVYVVLFLCLSLSLSFSCSFEGFALPAHPVFLIVFTFMNLKSKEDDFKPQKCVGWGTTLISVSIKYHYSSRQLDSHVWMFFILLLTGKQRKTLELKIISAPLNDFNIQSARRGTKLRGQTSMRISLQKTPVLFLLVNVSPPDWWNKFTRKHQREWIQLTDQNTFYLQVPDGNF